MFSTLQVPLDQKNHTFISRTEWFLFYLNAAVGGWAIYCILKLIFRVFFFAAIDQVYCIRKIIMSNGDL